LLNTNDLNTNIFNAHHIVVVNEDILPSRTPINNLDRIPDSIFNRQLENI